MVAIFDRLAAYVGRFVSRGSTEGESASTAAGGRRSRAPSEASRGEVVPGGVESDEIESRIDVTIETGLAPEEFIVRILAEQGGKLPQQAFTDYTDWSEPVVSRVLQRMEDDGHVVRVRSGREKVVYLPGNAPDSSSDAPDSSSDAPDGPRED